MKPPSRQCEVVIAGSESYCVRCSAVWDTNDEIPCRIIQLRLGLASVILAALLLLACYVLIPGG